MNAWMKVLFLVPLAVLACANVASAGSVDTFTNAGGAGDQLWSTGSNWANGHAPDSGATGIINSSGADGAILNSAAVVDNNLFLGLNGWPGAPSGGELTVIGGSLAVGGAFIIGANNASSYSMSAGTVTIAGTTDVGGSAGGDGTFTITGGAFSTNALQASAGTGVGTVNLFGGTLNITSDFATSLLFDNFGGSSSLEVAGSGTLIRAGDWVSDMNFFIGNGDIFTNEVGSTFDVSYDGGADLTTLVLNAIPEPSSLILLSLCGVAIGTMRRRRDR